jgi:hypothetical protein
VKDKRQLSQIYSSLLEFYIFSKQPMANWSQQHAVHVVEGRSWEREDNTYIGEVEANHFSRRRARSEARRNMQGNFEKVELGSSS